MIYECDECSAALPPGLCACPRCGASFEDAVPADALLPKSGFHAAASRAEDQDLPLQPGLAQAEADIAALRSQAIVLKSEVMALRSHVSTLIEEVSSSEERSAALQVHSAALQSQLVMLTNRLTVLEMAGREDKRRFIDHVAHVKEALGCLQIGQLKEPTSASGQ